MVFTVGKELREATAQASAGEALKVQVAYLQKELVLMGEQAQRARGQLAKISMRSGKHKHLYQECYQEQVRFCSFVYLGTSQVWNGNTIDKTE